ncbi:MAG: TolC family protein [Candidatus Caenarcaniphilales bacterium]|nr:TolC family protein [Candidatus Caenarcaniphilales bacterium]
MSNSFTKQISLIALIILLPLSALAKPNEVKDISMNSVSVPEEKEELNPKSSLEDSSNPDRNSLPQAENKQLPSTSPTQTLSAEIYQINNLKQETLPVTLEAALKLVETQNLTVKRGNVQARGATNRLRQAQIAVLPDLTGTFQQSRSQGGNQVFGNTVRFTRETVQPQLSLNWTISPGGREIFQILAERKRRKAGQIQSKETYQEQLSRAAEEFYNLQAAQDKRRVAQSGIEQSQLQLKLSQALYEVGRGTKLDVMRSENLVAQQKQALIEAETAIVQSEQTLLQRLNLEPQIHLQTLPASIEKNELVSLDSSLNELLNNAYSQNLDLQRLEQELKSLKHEFKATVASIVPDVTLRTFIGSTGNTYNDQIRNEFVGVTVTANLLQNLGLSIPFQLQAKGIEIEDKELEARENKRIIETNVSTNFLNSLNFYNAIKTSELQFQTAEEALRLARTRYKEGYSTSLEVVQAQLEVTNARNTLVNAISNFNKAQIRLLEALGKVDPTLLLRGLETKVASRKSELKKN